MPRGYQYFADVSSNNGEINVAAYARAGHCLIAIKATEGVNYINPYHMRQSEIAHEYGLTVMHYHFLTDESPQQQLNHFRNEYLRGWRAGDYVAIDSERSGRTPTKAETQDILVKCYSQTTHEPVLYSGEAFLNEVLTGIHVPGNRFWIANYS